jgi:small subunit ribosomal protein S20
LPNNKSCKKRLLTSAKRNERNRQNRAMMRSKIKTYRSEIEASTPEDKTTSLREMYSLIDTQARKGLMPKSRAARLKSRMAAAATK